MNVFEEVADPRVVALLRDGGIGVIPTDTVYGVVASARRPAAIERLYRVRKRDAHKACIVLVGSRSQIDDTAAWQPIDWHVTKRYWPGPVSIVVPTSGKTPAYLFHGDQSPPYRLPDDPQLRVLLNRVGPLVAPSANLQGEPPALNLEQAQAYFGKSVDFYVDGGELHNQPSTLITTQGGKITILRQGAGIIDQEDLS